jgi:hypothetical protein
MDEIRSKLEIEKHHVDVADSLNVIINDVKPAADGCLSMSMTNGLIGTINCDGLVIRPGWDAMGRLSLNPMEGTHGLAFTVQLEVSDVDKGLYLLGAFSLTIEQVEEIVKRMAAECELLRFEREQARGG